MKGTGNHAVNPGDPSYSADGRYLIYDTVPCKPSEHTLLHVRDLRTGRETTGPGFLGDADSVFLDRDTEVAFDAALAGTGTGLYALLQCGSGHDLSVVSTYNACLPKTALGNYRIVKIRAGHTWRITSGQDVPQVASW